MKKITLIAALLTIIFSTSTFAKITNEHAMVKATVYAILDDIDIYSVYDASIKDDNGEIIQTEIKYRDEGRLCKIWSWYDYEGNEWECPDCQEGDDCFCVYGECETKSGTSLKKYKGTKK